MSIREEIKSMIVKSGWTMSAVIKVINEKESRHDTLQNLSNKLTRGTIQYRDVKKIAEVIGYRIEWVKIE